MENSEKIIAQVKKSFDIREGLIAGIQESIDMDAELPKE
jgi:amino acid permease